MVSERGPFFYKGIAKWRRKSLFSTYKPAWNSVFVVEEKYALTGTYVEALPFSFKIKLLPTNACFKKKRCLFI